MANLNAPHGLQAVGTTHGGPYEIEEFGKVVGYTAIFIGDAVNRVADGSIEASATPGTTLYSGVSLNYGPTLTVTNHQVIISPETIFEAQDDNDTDGFAAADMGLNTNLNVASVAGSTLTGISGHQIDEGSINTTNTLDVHLRRLFPISGNAYGANSRIEITFNKHRMAPASVVGV